MVLCRSSVMLRRYLIAFALGELNKMSKLAEIRNQELLCRERALLDRDRKEFWLAKADELSQLAVDEIAVQFRNPDGTNFAATETHNKEANRTRV
jgi:hypothetical protein